MNTPNLKRNIMIRVYLIFFMQKLKNPLFLKLSVLALSFVYISFVLSFGDIVANSPHEPVALYYFSKAAFWNTEWIVKIMILAALGAVVFLIKDVPSYMRAIPRPKLIWRT